MNTSKMYLLFDKQQSQLPTQSPLEIRLHQVKTYFKTMMKRKLDKVIPLLKGMQ